MHVISFAMFESHFIQMLQDNPGQNLSPGLYPVKFLKDALMNLSFNSLCIKCFKKNDSGIIKLQPFCGQVEERQIKTSSVFTARYSFQQSEQK